MDECPETKKRACQPKQSWRMYKYVHIRGLIRNIRDKIFYRETTSIEVITM
jgi:hypothetical protein